NISNEKEKIDGEAQKNVDDGNKEEGECEDDNVEEANVPFDDYHDYEINDTQSSTEVAKYNDNVFGVTHVIDEANIAGASNAADIHAKNMDDVSCSVEKGSVNAVEVPAQKVVNVVKDKTVQVTKKEVPKKINVKAAVKTSAKAVEVPHDKVVDAVKKKVAAMTPFKQPRFATKSLKMMIKHLKEEEREMHEDVNRHELVKAKKKIFNDVHLVFFPCIKLSEETSNHHYLICFNMMTAEIDIIDNLHNDLEDLDLRYGPYAMALVSCSASL
ncbi:hypothetical protein Tco_1235043, partial [Tanacetum coccineum]